MGIIGDLIKGVGNILTGHSFGHDESDGQQYQVAQKAPKIQIKAPAVAAPREAVAPQGSAQGAKPSSGSMTPSFLAAAAMPNYGVPQSNVGGKSLLGQ